MDIFKIEYVHYVESCNQILRLFCEKHGYEYEEDSWVAGDVGTVALVGDLYVDLQDIITDLDKNVSEEKFLEWYDYSLEAYQLSINTPNYKSWLNGCPRYTDEELKMVRKTKEEAMARELEWITDIHTKKPIKVEASGMYGAINQEEGRFLVDFMVNRTGSGGGHYQFKRIITINYQDDYVILQRKLIEIMRKEKEDWKIYDVEINKIEKLF